MMRERKTYRGSRLSSGLKDEFNDIFKNRAMEKKASQPKRPLESEPQQPQPSKKTSSSMPSSGTTSTTTTKATNNKPPKKKFARDVFDMQSSDDEVMPTGSKQARPSKPSKPATKVSNATKPDINNKITKKPAPDVFDMDSSDDGAIGRASKQLPQSKPKKLTTESRNGSTAGPRISGKAAVSSASNSDGEPIRTKTKPATQEVPKEKKPALKEPKRKMRATSDSDPDRKIKLKKSKPSKETTIKRKSEKDVEVDGVQKPAAKRQDRTTKIHNLPYPTLKDENTKKQLNGVSKKEYTASKLPSKKPSAPVTEILAPEPVDTPVYDLAVDISYASLSSPVKEKPPTLTREPSAVEMPSLLTELIESRVAEIEEQQPAKKIKRLLKKAKTVEMVEEASQPVEDSLPVSTEIKEAEQQAQIQSAMFAADYGVRTTRSKFRNEGAAKKSYGVAQRTMRHPVTEEEQIEDQKLELNRTREEAANKARREEEKQKKEAEIEKATAIAAAAATKKPAKGKANEKEAAGKGKGKAKDSAYDMDDDDGPKVMSRHALLQKGRHQRVLNEIDALVEDSQKENPTRRSSVLDVAFRMSNNTEVGKEFVQKFRLNSYDAKLLRDLDKEQDALTRIGFGWVMFILLNEELHSGRAIDLMLENGGFEMLKTMLTSDEDLDDLARSSVLKLQIQINLLTGKLRSRLLQCRFIRSDIPGHFSQRYIALMILSTMLKSVNKDEGRKAILEQFDPQEFVEILNPVTDFVVPPNGPTLTNFYLSAGILSHYSQSARIHTPLNELLEESHMKTLSNLLPTVLEWKIMDSTEDVDRIKDFQTAVLKLCIDRTNDDPETSTLIADHRNGLAIVAQTCVKQFKNLNGITDPEDDISKDIDILILTSILLSNLLEFSETARMFLRVQKLGEETLIKPLMDVFVARHDRLELAESVEETHLNVAFGYLTVALAYACRDHEIRIQLRNQLRGTLEPLIIAVTAFKVQNQTLEEVENAISSQDDLLLGLEEEATSNRLSYTKRLEDILDELENYSAR
ncbi:hypothetical protein H072_2584 [Dactylellina haptotyla CBS 200.50]|uniref:Wings apart-like protein C-terminal domain-containing protein n=1 Tax=Dactylellina haptotyla (strain CBS 200.50) TaxID=1284197 RepID=S8AQT5_DACHA|nr:hypothetical protein H072_2584 [Dactylellina haptotyla CBS 200.50]